MEKKKISIGTEEIAYLDIGSGEPVLMIHGNMSSGVHYEPLISRISDKYRCISPDIRGFGDSSYNSRFSSLEELADDLALFLDAIGVDSCFVIGWSTGGGIGLKLAAKYPNKVKKFFSIEGAGHRGYPIYVKENFKSTGKPYASKEEMASDPMQVAPMISVFEKKDAAMMTSIWDATIYTVSKPTQQQNELWISETLKQRNLVDLDWSLATLNMSDELTVYGKGDGSIKDVKCPTAFTTGEKDVVVPGYMVLDNYNALKDNATLLPYENCGHSPMVDCPDRLANDVVEFFSK
ncbi:MAG: alpha/beta hydrolase [Clostridia bacterium]|nr:alpha/beta hydrolase [Clostridia bacterium]